MLSTKSCTVHGKLLRVQSNKIQQIRSLVFKLKRTCLYTVLCMYDMNGRTDNMTHRDDDKDTNDDGEAYVACKMLDTGRRASVCKVGRRF